MTTATGETTTYKAWTEWAEDGISKLQELYRQLDNMAATVSGDDGDAQQIEAIRRWQSDIEGAIAGGQQMLAGVATTQVPVGEAVQAAGGSANTPHKQYADEARDRRGD
jgi:hypothetical protein